MLFDEDPEYREYLEILSKPTRLEIVTGLREYIRRNSNTNAARQARMWLLEDAVVGGDWNGLQIDTASLRPDLLPTDSTLISRIEYLMSVSQFKSQQRDTVLVSSVFSSEDPVESRPKSWAVLENWFQIRRALELSPDDEGIRSYLEWEGKARASGLFGLWVAGLRFTPEGSRARDMLEDLIHRHGDALGGSLEGAWLEKTLNGIENNHNTETSDLPGNRISITK